MDKDFMIHMSNNDPGGGSLMRRAIALVVLFAALLVAGCGGGNTKTETTVKEKPGPNGQKVVTAKVDSGDKGTKPDVTIKVPAKVYNKTKSEFTHEGLKSEAKQSARSREQEAKFKDFDKLPANAGLGASDSIPGCVTRFVRNQSARTALPWLFVLHETVSPNVPGWNDVNAVVALFDRSSSSASSTFVIDHEGHCAYIVPLLRKPWTQAAANSFSVSVEFIDTATSRDGSYCGGDASPGCKKLASVFWSVKHRIPRIRAAVGDGSGCFVHSAGIVDHRSLGQCAGGHVDISPWSYRTVAAYIASHPSGGSPAPWTVSCESARPSLRRIQAALNAHGASPRLVVDGIWGPKSKAALKRFQDKTPGVPTTGTIGARTRKALGVCVNG